MKRLFGSERILRTVEDSPLSKVRMLIISEQTRVQVIKNVSVVTVETLTLDVLLAVEPKERRGRGNHVLMPGEYNRRKKCSQ